MSKGHYQPLCQRRRKRQRTSLLLFLKLDKTFADMKLHLARCIFAEKFGKYTDWMAKVKLRAKRRTCEPPYIRCAGNRKSPSQLSHFNGDKRTSIREFRLSYHMMTSGRHGNVMWHIDTGEDAGGLSFHLFPSLMKMKRELFRNQSDI